MSFCINPFEKNQLETLKEMMQEPLGISLKKLTKETLEKKSENTFGDMFEKFLEDLYKKTKASIDEFL